MKTLLLLRHAKSDWDAAYGADHERPLNDRGARSARIMGRLINAQGIAPQFAISSTAVRARTTVELAAEAGNWDCPITLDAGLYESGLDGVLALAASAPDVERLMLVGHQPTWSMLVHRLTGARADMKTASVAAIELMLDGWSDLPETSGVLTALHHPRPYFGSEWDDVAGSAT
ncbi:MAG: histidine phosphatase family protein [Actinomycetota bacterium]|nr:histidine phosphatase family protein [Actinomycetota bacterium]